MVVNSIFTCLTCKSDIYSPSSSLSYQTLFPMVPLAEVKLTRGTKTELSVCPDHISSLVLPNTSSSFFIYFFNVFNFPPSKYVSHFLEKSRLLCCVIFQLDKVDLRTSPKDIWDVWVVAESLPVKEIRYSLEVVAVLADHPPKIKSITCVRVLKIIECIYSLLNMHVPFSRPLSLYLSRVLIACLHMVVASSEARISRMT